MANIESAKISIYPATNRKDSIGNGAVRLDRFPTEAHITESLSSFISKNNETIISSQSDNTQAFIINGMGLSFSGSTLTIAAGKCVMNGYFIELKSAIAITPNSNTEVYLQLHTAIDSNFGRVLNGTDSSDATPTLASISLDFTPATSTAGETIYNFCIAEFASNEWKTPTSATFPYSVDQIYISTSANGNENNTSLKDYLTNLNINSGSID